MTITLRAGDAPVHTATTQAVLDAVTAASFGCRSEELSLLGFAAHVGSAGSLAHLIGVHDGALKFRIADGAAALPTHLTRELGDQVRLDHPVTRIRRTDGAAILRNRRHRHRHNTRHVRRQPHPCGCADSVHRPPPDRRSGACWIPAPRPAVADTCSTTSRRSTAPRTTARRLRREGLGGAETSHIWEGHMDGAVRASPANSDALHGAVGNLSVGVEVMPLHTNTPLVVARPTLELTPQHATDAKGHLSCRDAVLDAIEQLQRRTGATEFARREIVAEVQASGTGFERQTIYRCIRRLSGHEPGSAHRDLADLGNNRLRLHP